MLQCRQYRECLGKWRKETGVEFADSVESRMKSTSPKAWGCESENVDAACFPNFDFGGSGCSDEESDLSRVALVENEVKIWIAGQRHPKWSPFGLSGGRREMEGIREKWCLFLLAAIYMIGELGHFLLGTVSRALAQDVHYGDMGCLKIADFTEIRSETCTDITEEFECKNVTEITNNGTEEFICTWDYTGLGLEYHILAGPAFVAAFTVAGLAWGYFADKLNRVHLLTAATLIFSLAIMGTSLSTAYWHILISRMLLALGESGCSPLASGIITDMFPKSHRGLAMSLFNWGIYIGYGLSYTVGNYVTEANLFNKGWRAAYMVSGIPGIALAILLFLSTTEPQRTSTEEDAVKDSNQVNANSKCQSAFPSIGTSNNDNSLKYGAKQQNENESVGGESSSSPREESEKPQLEMQDLRIESENGCGNRSEPEFKAHYDQSDEPWYKALIQALQIGWNVLKKPAATFLLLGACVRHAAGFCWGYNSALYFKTYYPDYDVSLWLTGISIGAGAMGALIGGYLSDVLVSKLGISARALVLALSQLVASPFAFAVFFLDPPLSLVSLLFGYIAAEMWFGVMFAILVEMVPSKIRSKSVAVVLFCINNIGGNAPVIVDPIAHVTSYRTAIIILYPGALITSSILFFICWGTLRSQQKQDSLK